MQFRKRLSSFSTMLLISKSRLLPKGFARVVAFSFSLRNLNFLEPVEERDLEIAHFVKPEPLPHKSRCHHPGRHVKHQSFLKRLQLEASSLRFSIAR